ncbi:MAG: acetate kinase [Bacteroidota bacterium]|nr:acetate kinase [Bacteroidota bacterium]MDP4227087.1 acetate kinase [Bacteroidota bacterium]MDP4273707.1 acetate kinase [Bacteroidota bacterium]
MKIIVINCGSSSIKYQLFDTKNREVLAKGIIEKIGLHGSFLKNERNDGDQVKLEGEIIDHQAGIEYMLGVLSSEAHGSIKKFDEIDAVGHRVVHGGEKFNTSVLITDDVIRKVEECIDLAPLHNPPNLRGIFAMQTLLPKVPQVGVFDTAFHQTMPDMAYMYAIPYSLYKKYGLRRYGFHGTSHRYVSQRICEILGVDIKTKRIITCHLGNGASVAAIKYGESVDTSMGLTPVEGLIMGTRTGDLDLGVLTYIMAREEININTANTLINKHSGMLGISGVSSDMREIQAAAEQGNQRAQLALNMFHYRVRKYIGAYTAVLGGVDIIVFTGGIGENSDISRELICKDFEYLGLEFDHEKNKGVRGKETVISKSNSKVVAAIVPTNEELMIAMDTEKIVKRL